MRSSVQSIQCLTQSPDLTLKSQTSQIYIYMGNPSHFGRALSIFVVFSPEISKKCPKKICLNLADFFVALSLLDLKMSLFPLFRAHF